MPSMADGASTVIPPTITFETKNLGRTAILSGGSGRTSNKQAGDKARPPKRNESFSGKKENLVGGTAIV